MRCYYEVLEVPRDASADDLKVQYRKLALKWHPDKNVNNVDEATEMFKEITAAYACLSDPNERQWYDDHREAILKGMGDDDDADDIEINLFPYFSTSCYSGKVDSPTGFYAVYGNVFHRINEREKEYANYNRSSNNDGDSSIRVPPEFGNSTSSDDAVTKFYDYWLNFSSCLTFASEDKYNTNDDSIPRYMRRYD